MNRNWQELSDDAVALHGHLIVRSCGIAHKGGSGLVSSKLDTVLGSVPYLIGMLESYFEKYGPLPEMTPLEPERPSSDANQGAGPQAP